MTMHGITAEISDRACRKLEREDALRRMTRDEQAALAAAGGQAMAASWYVACVYPGHELQVEQALRQIGAEALVPMRKGRRRKRRGRILPPVDEVLMTGYVLVRFVSSAKALRGLLRIEKVSTILGGWETPYPVGNVVVDALMQRSGHGAFDYERQSDVRLAAGDRVRIADGLFEGQAGTVVTPNTTGRGDVVIEVDLFGRKTPMVMPLVMVEKG